MGLDEQGSIAHWVGKVGELKGFFVIPGGYRIRRILLTKTTLTGIKLKKKKQLAV